MFWIFKIFPDWLWPALLIAAIIGYFLSPLVSQKPYTLVIKNICSIVAILGIFICGALYADRTWQQAARELQAKVEIMEAKSQQVNEVIKTQVVTKLQIVKLRGEDTLHYIDREVVKTDAGCVISSEFIQAHNRAAEQPK